VTELSASGTGLVSAVTLTTVHPVILGTRTLSATAGTPYSNALQPSQYQVAGGVISWTFTGGVPTGMTAPGNGFLSWPAPVAGTYHILATAHSSNGAAGRGEFVLTVK
jgi:serine protease